MEEKIWELLDNGQTYRMKVPGGWLVRSFAQNVAVEQAPSGIGVRKMIINVGVCMTFVADEKHEWQLPKKEGADNVAKD